MGDERKWEWLDGKVENSDLRMAVREARDQLTGFKTEHVEKLWELINLIILEWRVSKEETPLKKKGKSDIRREFATSFGNKLDLIDEFVKCYHENHTPLVDLEKSTPLPSLYSVLILGEAEQGNATSALKAANHLTKSKTLISAIRVKEECKTINKSLRKFKKLRANQKKGGLAKAKNQCEAIITRNRKIIQLEEEFLDEGIPKHKVRGKILKYMKCHKQWDASKFGGTLISKDIIKKTILKNTSKK